MPVWKKSRMETFWTIFFCAASLSSASFTPCCPFEVNQQLPWFTPCWSTNSEHRITWKRTAHTCVCLSVHVCMSVCTVERGSSLAPTEVNSVCRPSPVLLCSPLLPLPPGLSHCFRLLWQINRCVSRISQRWVKWHSAEKSRTLARLRKKISLQPPSWVQPVVGAAVREVREAAEPALLLSECFSPSLENLCRTKWWIMNSF